MCRLRQWGFEVRGVQAVLNAAKLLMQKGDRGRIRSELNQSLVYFRTLQKIFHGSLTLNNMPRTGLDASMTRMKLQMLETCYKYLCFEKSQYSGLISYI